MKITNTVTRKFGTEEVRAEISNTSKSFAFRLVVGEYSTGWTIHCTGILLLRSPVTDNLYGYVTAYWDSNGMPIEEPFLIIRGTKC